MSAIIIDDDLIHYEVLGRGKPIILLHGWLGSWRYWVSSMQQLAMQYRCYALDMWGFGDLGKDPSRYSFDHQVRLLSEFIDEIGIPKNVVIVGHGLGAAVGAAFASSPDALRRDRVYRMLLVAPPLMEGAPPPNSGSQLLTEGAGGYGQYPILGDGTINSYEEETRQMPSSSLGRSVIPGLRTGKRDTSSGQTVVQNGNPIYNLFNNQPLDFLLRRAIAPGSPHYEKLRVEIRKGDPMAVVESTRAFSEVNTFYHLLSLRNQWETIVKELLAEDDQQAQKKRPPGVCVVLGEDDQLLPRPEKNLVNRLSENHVKVLTMNGGGHYPMLESEAAFVRLVKEFLEADIANLDKLEIKDEWRRRQR